MADKPDHLYGPKQGRPRRVAMAGTALHGPVASNLLRGTIGFPTELERQFDQVLFRLAPTLPYRPIQRRKQRPAQ